jgi:predicted nucleic acid-binding protein
MGKIKLPSGQKIMLDTAPFIYYIENVEPYASSLQSLFNAISTGHTMAVTSVVTLIEVLTKPIQDGRSDLTERFRMYLTGSKNLELMSVTQEIGEQAAHLRAKYRLRIPDAIQVATALVSRSSILLTNDRSLKKVMEVDVLILEDITEFEE